MLLHANLKHNELQLVSFLIYPQFFVYPAAQNKGIQKHLLLYFTVSSERLMLQCPSNHKSDQQRMC